MIDVVVVVVSACVYICAQKRSERTYELGHTVTLPVACTAYICTWYKHVHTHTHTQSGKDEPTNQPTNQPWGQDTDLHTSWPTTSIIIRDPPAPVIIDTNQQLHAYIYIYICVRVWLQPVSVSQASKQTSKQASKESVCKHPLTHNTCHAPCSSTSLMVDG